VCVTQLTHHKIEKLEEKDKFLAKLTEKLKWKAQMYQKLSEKLTL
jgi:hypothetical protein